MQHKKWLAKQVKGWKSLNNQNDPTAVELMRRNNKRYGVGYGKQIRHAANVLWIFPMVFVLSKIGDVLNGAPIHPALKLVVLSGLIVSAVWWFVRDMERTDPVEKMKLQTGVKYHVEKGRGIVDEEGHVVG